MGKKKGFTLIELIVVIAVLGILVLLATPKFVGYVGDAREVNIENDVRAYENFIEGKLVNNSAFTKDWGIYPQSEVDSMKNSGAIYDYKGKTTLPENKEFKKPENVNVNSKLKGTFIFDEESGRVYYHDSNAQANNNVTPPAPVPPVHTGPLARIEITDKGENAVSTLKMIPLIQENFDLRGIVHSHQPLNASEMEQLILDYNANSNASIYVMDSRVQNNPENIELLYDGYYTYFVKKGNVSEVHHYKNDSQKYIVGNVNMTKTTVNGLTLNMPVFSATLKKHPMAHLLVNNGLDVVDINHPDNELSMYAIRGHNVSLNTIKSHISNMDAKSIGYMMGIDLFQYPNFGSASYVLSYNMQKARQHANFAQFTAGTFMNPIEVGNYGAAPIYEYRNLQPGDKITFFAYREDLKTLSSLQESDSAYFVKYEYTHQ